MDFYSEYAQRFCTMSDDAKRREKEHYTRCHEANIKAGRKDLIIFTRRILEVIEASETMKGDKTA